MKNFYNRLKDKFKKSKFSKPIRYALGIVRNIKKKRIERNAYKYWQLSNNLSLEELESQRKVKFEYEPKISVIACLSNTKINYLKNLINSLKEQTYSNWELCLADCNKIKLVEIQEIAKDEPKIKYKYFGEECEDLNKALELATGEYIGILGQNDCLSKDCLYQLVEKINENLDVKFIYSDEDKISKNGKKRFNPYFKPDFSPDSLRSSNYIGHFYIVRKELLSGLKGFDSKYNKAQEYDLILRITEKIEDKEIKHISKILYHSRDIKISKKDKEKIFENEKLVIEKHLERLNLKAEVKNGKTEDSFEIQYKVIGNPKVSIMIPNKDEVETLKKCINSILEKTTYENYEINIIENNSENKKTFSYYSELEKNSRIHVLKYPDKGFNYSRIMNFGARNSSGDFLVQLNNDTELITPNWLEKMIGFCQREDVGAVGCTLYYPDKTYQHAGVTIGVGGIAANRFKDIKKNKHGYFAKESKIENLSAVTAACIMTKKSIYEEVGYMNEVLKVAFNDVDFCLRIRKTGKLIVYNPFVEFWHYESKSRGSENSPEKVKRFQSEILNFEKDWKEILENGDPYYNKNLSLNSERYDIKMEKVD